MYVQCAYTYRCYRSSLQLSICLCHNCATRNEPLCANTRFFDTLNAVLPCGLAVTQVAESEWRCQKIGHDCCETLDQHIGVRIPGGQPKSLPQLVKSLSGGLVAADT